MNGAPLPREKDTKTKLEGDHAWLYPGEDGRLVNDSKRQRRKDRCIERLSQRILGNGQGNGMTRLKTADRLWRVEPVFCIRNSPGQ